MLKGEQRGAFWAEAVVDVLTPFEMGTKDMTVRDLGRAHLAASGPGQGKPANQ